MNTRKISPAELHAGDILCDDSGKPLAILTVKDTHGTDNPRTVWDTVSYPDLGPYLCVGFPPGTDAVIADVPRITEANAGCWLDGAHGWHNVYRVVDRAVTYGFTVPEDSREALAWFRAGDHTAHVEAQWDMYEVVTGQGGLSDMATEFLSLRAPEGHTFVWDAGELSLMTEADAEEFGHFG